MNQFSEDKLIKKRLAGIKKTARIYKRLDDKSIPNIDNEIRLFVVARNEEVRLPYFFHYYSELGVNRFFLIDNDSSDRTVEISLKTKNVHVFQITESFKNFWHWVEYLLENYGMNQWCLVVDVDELFSYPYAESLPLPKLTEYLDINHCTAVKSFLLDMYSKKSINTTEYVQGTNPLKACPYFESGFRKKVQKFFDPKHNSWYIYDSVYGGVRERVFGQIGKYNWSYCLSKISLLKYSDDVYLSEGMHTLNGGCFSDIEGITFHTKFLFDFVQRAFIESEREVHFCDGIEYKFYSHHLNLSPELSLYKEKSIRYKDTSQLVKLGIMKSSKHYEQFIENQPSRGLQ